MKTTFEEVKGLFLWRFETARYTVGFWAEEEDMAPDFDNPRDLAFANDGEPAHWFYAQVGVFDHCLDGEMIGSHSLGGCSYGSFEEFFKGHWWQYQRAGARPGKWLTDPKSPEFRRALARRERRSNGKLASGSYFVDMVRSAIEEARQHGEHPLRTMIRKRLAADRSAAI
jgi:hypothetical protein